VGDDIYSNITNYTSSDGYIYINLGNIPGEINKDGKTFTSSIDTSILTHVKSGISSELLHSIQTMLMNQIVVNSGIIKTNILKLQNLQTNAYNTINTIYYYLMGSGTQPGILGYLYTFPIPILTDSQITAATAISTSEGQLTNNVTKDTYKTAQDVLNDYRPNGNFINIDPKNYLGGILNIFGNLLSSTQQNAKSLFNKDNINSLTKCISKLEQIYDNNNTNKPNNLFTARKFLSLISGSLTSLIQFKNYIIGVDTQNLFNDQTSTQNWWNYVLWAQAKFATDWDNYIATNPNWNKGSSGQNNNGNTLYFAPAPAVGKSIGSVLASVAQSASANVPGLQNTSTSAKSLNYNIQRINDAIKTTNQAASTTLDTINNLGQDITSIYFS